MKSFLNYLVGIVCVIYLVFATLVFSGLSFGGATETISEILLIAPPYLIGACALVNVLGKGVFRIVLFIVIVLCLILYGIGANTDLLSKLFQK